MPVTQHASALHKCVLYVQCCLYAYCVWWVPDARFLLCLQRLEQEVVQLRALNAELLEDKQEALPLLDAYRSVTQSCFLSCAAYCVTDKCCSQRHREVTLMHV